MMYRQEADEINSIFLCWINGRSIQPVHLGGNSFESNKITAMSPKAVVELGSEISFLIRANLIKIEI